LRNSIAALTPDIPIRPHIGDEHIECRGVRMVNCVSAAVFGGGIEPNIFRIRSSTGADSAYLQEIEVHIRAGCRLGGLWQSRLNEFPSRRLFLYSVLLKRRHKFLGLFLDGANFPFKLEFGSARARGLCNSPVVSLNHNRFMLHALSYPKAIPPQTVELHHCDGLGNCSLSGEVKRGEPIPENWLPLRSVKRVLPNLTLHGLTAEHCDPHHPGCQHGSEDE
jgi:hypothetical protein